jgi:hypothetical protein
MTFSSFDQRQIVEFGWLKDAVVTRTLAALLCLAGAACHRSGSAQDSPAGSSAPDEGLAATAARPLSGDCQALDVLVPFRQYGQSDLIRSMAVDSGEVYFRTMDETYRVPLAGGAASVIAKSLGDVGGPSWVIGDKLVSQPTGQPALMAIPKGGGTWTPLLDATSDKHGGAGAVPTILGNVRRGRVESAERAIFDGGYFYWIGEDIVGLSMGTKGTSTWSVRRMALSGPAETLYKSNLELGSLVKAGDRLLFAQSDKPEKATPPERPAQHGGKLEIHLPEPKTWSLLSMPANGGTPEVRLRPFSPPSMGATIVADGSLVYYGAFSGLTFGLYRLSADGNSPAQLVDPKIITVHWGAPYGADRLVLFASGIEGAGGAGSVKHFVLTAPRGSDVFERTACVDSTYTTHAFGVGGKSLLVALYRGKDNTAGIVRIALP